jgi:NADH:ubiquinone oxidoreductase subunit K
LFFLDKTIPWIGAVLIGLVAGEISVPVAVVVWLFRAFNVL